MALGLRLLGPMAMTMARAPRRMPLRQVVRAQVVVDLGAVAQRRGVVEADPGNGIVVVVGARVAQATVGRPGLGARVPPWSWRAWSRPRSPRRWWGSLPPAARRSRSVLPAARPTPRR